MLGRSSSGGRYRCHWGRSTSVHVRTLTSRPVESQRCKTRRSQNVDDRPDSWWTAHVAAAAKPTPTQAAGAAAARPGGEFFGHPTGPNHRRYEALRAYFVARRPLKEIAQQSGSTYNTLRDVIGDFRARCREDRVPPVSRHPDRGDRNLTARSRQSPRKPRRWRIVGGWTSPRDAD